MTDLPIAKKETKKEKALRLKLIRDIRKDAERRMRDEYGIVVKKGHLAL